ncbi:MAG TPA: hypothetical protein PKD47_08565, partial [Solirubrobacterales bacterium]|nr:hypothetical protein [Solirubrobacterales bacterium]
MNLMPARGWVDIVVSFLAVSGHRKSHPKAASVEGDLATLLASPAKAVGDHEVPDGFGPAHNTADSRESWRSFIGFKLIDNPESRFPLMLRIIQVNLPQTH